MLALADWLELRSVASPISLFGSLASAYWPLADDKTAIKKRTAINNDLGIQISSLYS